jgi:hypothetical protein
MPAACICYLNKQNTPTTHFTCHNRLPTKTTPKPVPNNPCTPWHWLQVRVACKGDERVLCSTAGTDTLEKPEGKGACKVWDKPSQSVYRTWPQGQRSLQASTGYAACAQGAHTCIGTNRIRHVPGGSLGKVPTTKITVQTSSLMGYGTSCLDSTWSDTTERLRVGTITKRWN